MKKELLYFVYSLCVFVAVSFFMVRCADKDDINNLDAKVNDLRRDISKLKADTAAFFDKTYDITSSNWKKTFEKTGASTASNFKYEIPIDQFTASNLEKLVVEVQGFVYPNKSDFYTFNFPYIDVAETIEVRYSFYLRNGKLILEQALYDRDNKPKPQESANASLERVRVVGKK